MIPTFSSTARYPGKFRSIFQVWKSSLETRFQFPATVRTGLSEPETSFRLLRPVLFFKIKHRIRHAFILIGWERTFWDRLILTLTRIYTNRVAAHQLYNFTLSLTGIWQKGDNFYCSITRISSFFCESQTPPQINRGHLIR